MIANSMPFHSLLRGVMLLLTAFAFHVPPEYADLRHWLEQHAPVEEQRLTALMGSAPAGTLSVEVVHSDARIPPWADGIYSDGQMIIRGLPMERFPEVFRHELAHAFLFARLGEGRAPLWFHEGMAGLLSGESREFLPGLLAHVKREPRLSDLADEFPPEGLALQLAYAKAQAVVTFIRREGGWETLLGVLNDARGGRSFESALLYRTGRGSRAWEEAFYAADSERFLIALVTSSSLLWALFAVLLVIAYRRQQQARKAVLEAWEEEDDHDSDVPRV
jgi:hypothetical protein